MTKYRTKIPLDPDTRASKYDLKLEGIESWEVSGGRIVVVHNEECKELTKKWLKSHPDVVHEVIVEEEEE